MLRRPMPSGRLLAMQKKNSAAVQLGRRGGLARAKKQSKEALSKIGRKGARARWEIAKRTTRARKD
jgi:hypothetical protein